MAPAPTATLGECWSTAPSDVRLEPDAVHIWRAFLDRDEDAGTLAATLADDERGRAARFVFELHRSRFVRARGILRDILARYLRRSPAAIAFAYEDEGKPSVQRAPSDPPLSFNVSHSQGIAVYAVACGRTVGIDIEQIKSEFSGSDIAEHFFSPAEVRELAAVSSDRQSEAFFLGWTRKEAYVKARGGGLGIPLHTFDVTLSPGSAARLTSVDAERWTLQSFQPADGYAGAVVAEGADWDIRLWDWRPA